jgi:hypothetical protein
MFVMLVNLMLEIIVNIFLLPIKFFVATVLGARNKVFYLLWGQSRVVAAPADETENGVINAPISYPVQGGGVYGMRLGRFFAEMTGSGGKSETTGGDYLVSTSGGSGFMNMGYMVKRGSYVRLYPLVGIGGSGAGIAVAESGEDDDDAEPPMVVGGPMLNLGFGAELKLGKSFGVMIGLRAGLIFAPFGSENAKIFTPYTHLITGMGSFDREKKRSKKKKTKKKKSNDKSK